MASYTKLVERISENDVLAKALKTDDKKYLNLVTEDWEAILENDIKYQDLVSKGENVWKPPVVTDKYTFEKMKDEFQVYLVGSCRIAKKISGNANHKPAVLLTGMGPMIKIANDLCKDAQFEEGIDFKFNFSSCSPISCNLCSVYSKKFSERKYKLKPNQPCISDTKIFDGEHIVNRFQCTIEESFEGYFLALLRLKINSRYSFKSEDGSTGVRIGGIVADIVAFQESKLSESKEINVGDLTPVEEPSDNNDLEEAFFAEREPKRPRLEVEMDEEFA